MVRYDGGLPFRDNRSASRACGNERGGINVNKASLVLYRRTTVRLAEVGKGFFRSSLPIETSCVHESFIHKILLK